MEFNPLTFVFHYIIINAYINLHLKAVSLFNYVWLLIGHQILWRVLKKGNIFSSLLWLKWERTIFSLKRKIDFCLSIPNLLKFLKTVFHKFYLVNSWILCLIYNLVFLDIYEIFKFFLIYQPCCLNVQKNFFKKIK